MSSALNLHAHESSPTQFSVIQDRGGTGQPDPFQRPSTVPLMPFLDLGAQRNRLGNRIDEAISRVLDHGQFVMGPEVSKLEKRLSEHCGSRNVVGCSSGTDALLLALMALKVEPGDAVLIPSFTFVATAEAVALLGAKPVFIDVEQHSFCLDEDSIMAGVAAARNLSLRPVGIISVDLFGQPADYASIERLAADLDLWLICDSAQSYGSTYQGRKTGTFGNVATTSFYPSKPLGCYGDGGALFTNDDELAETIRSVLAHGTGKDKYDNVRLGINGRLDTIQAAILLEKLEVFDEEIEMRNAIAERYSEAFESITSVNAPRTRADATSTWAQYTLRLDGVDRDAFCHRLRDQGVPTAIYYPRPLHRQTAYLEFPVAGNGLPVAEMLCQSVVSLPLHAYLERDAQDRIMAAVRQAAS